ncbi:conserved hypothetical protein [Methylobacterium nodulans ORS 2060]|uniref:Phasin domain-containing protein n=2 Tax=Methylobacterium nodulans TaxID=114616 RepID=B8ISW8_METNO|nr:conserved hypothetical protein [Methylobacterium nodulans ORS 2060]
MVSPAEAPAVLADSAVPAPDAAAARLDAASAPATDETRIPAAMPQDMIPEAAPAAAAPEAQPQSDQASDQAREPAPAPDETEPGLAGLAEMNTRVLAFMRDETEAALSFWSALCEARTPADVARLQVAEVRRSLAAALACWSDLARLALRRRAF